MKDSHEAMLPADFCLQVSEMSKTANPMKNILKYGTEEGFESSLSNLLSNVVNSYVRMAVQMHNSTAIPSHFWKYEKLKASLTLGITGQ